MFHKASYKIKIQKNGMIETVAGYQYFKDLGCCINFLNNQFNKWQKKIQNEKGIFLWSIRNDKDFYSEVFEMNQNFIEEILFKFKK